MSTSSSVRESLPEPVHNDVRDEIFATIPDGSNPDSCTDREPWGPASQVHKFAQEQTGRQIAWVSYTRSFQP